MSTPFTLDYEITYEGRDYVAAAYVDYDGSVDIETVYLVSGNRKRAVRLTPATIGKMERLVATEAHNIKRDCQMAFEG